MKGRGIVSDSLQTKQYIGQQKALERCKEALYKNRKGTLLNCGMGTGKTRMAINWIQYLQDNVVKPQGKTLCVVIACPVALLPEPKALNPGGWAGELKKWWGDMDGKGSYETYMGRQGTTGSRASEIVSMCKRHSCGGTMRGVTFIVAQSYDSWRQPALAQTLDAIGSTESFYKLLICDESHRCKGPNTSTTKTMHRFADKCDQALLLSGTPMPHTPLDMWAQGRMVYESSFGRSFFAFRSKYANMRQLDGRAQMFVGMKPQMLPEFKRRMDYFTYTLTVEDALDLPALTHNTIHVPMDGKERKAYDQMKKQLVAEIEINKALGEVSAANVLSQIGKLSQITGGSIKTETGETVSIGSSKADALYELLSEDISPDEPVVVFGRYRADLDSAKGSAEKAGRRAFELSGRKKELEAWRSDSGGSVLVVQESAGGVGIDLTRASRLIFFSVEYSLGNFEQAIARVYRAGQDMPVNIIHLVSPGTIDEVIYESIQNKKNMVNAALGYLGIEMDEPVGYEPTNEDDWRDLLGYD